MKTGAVQEVRGVALVALLGVLGCGGTTTVAPGSNGGTSNGGSPNGGAANGGTSNGGTSNGGASSASLCERYCDVVMKNCTAAAAPYSSRDTCLGVCGALPPGSPGDTTGNTVECRLGHAESAATTENQTNCGVAGPAGNGVCGESCEGFCAVVRDACPDDAIAGATCAADCAALPDLGLYDASQQSGNSLQCRLYHVSAATIDPLVHCRHVDGVGPCAALP